MCFNPQSNSTDNIYVFFVPQRFPLGAQSSLGYAPLSIGLPVGMPTAAFYGGISLSIYIFKLQGLRMIIITRGTRGGIRSILLVHKPRIHHVGRFPTRSGPGEPSTVPGTAETLHMLIGRVALFVGPGLWREQRCLCTCVSPRFPILCSHATICALAFACTFETARFAFCSLCVRSRNVLTRNSIATHVSTSMMNTSYLHVSLHSARALACTRKNVSVRTSYA